MIPYFRSLYIKTSILYQNMKALENILDLKVDVSTRVGSQFLSAPGAPLYRHPNRIHTDLTETSFLSDRLEDSRAPIDLFDYSHLPLNCIDNHHMQDLDYNDFQSIFQS